MDQRRNFLAVLLGATPVAVLVFAATASATTLTSPAGTAYTGALEATGSASMQGSWSSISCKHSTLEGTVESHGASVTAAVGVGSWTFSECNYPVTVKKPGSLAIHSDGSVTSTGTEITLHTSIGECVYTSNGSTIGTLTSGTPATFDFKVTQIPRTGGTFLCGPTAVFAGEYTFTNPGALVVD